MKIHPISLPQHRRIFSFKPNKHILVTKQQWSNMCQQYAACKISYWKGASLPSILGEHKTSTVNDFKQEMQAKWLLDYNLCVWSLNGRGDVKQLASYPSHLILEI